MRKNKGFKIQFKREQKSVSKKFPLQASENGTIQLYKKMQAENLAREAEISELRDRLNK